MNDLVSRHGTDVMVVEVGMSRGPGQRLSVFLADLIAKTRTVSGKPRTWRAVLGTAVVRQLEWYTLGAFDNSGRPTTALERF